MKTNQEIIEELSKEIRLHYSGIVSEEVVEGAVDWWVKLTKEALEAKDQACKEAMIKLVESFPIKTMFRDKLCWEAANEWIIKNFNKLNNNGKNQNTQEA